MTNVIFQNMRLTLLSRMKRKLGRGWVAIFLFASGAGCNEILGNQPGEKRPAEYAECVSPGDCFQFANECRKASSCDNGQCQFDLLAAGELTALQVPGDCAVLTCDGKGGMLLEPSSDDYDDDNPCTKDSCIGTSVLHEPLQQVDCYPGPASTKGVGICKPGIQQCSAGKPIGNCEGAVTPIPESCATPFDDDCDGQVNVGGSDCTCLPGAITSCYSGAAGTLGKGQCHAGTQTCLADGTGYGPCTNEKLPEPETCDPLHVDEDCDGMINEEGANCQCGDGITQTNLGEECDDANKNPTDTCVNCQKARCGDGYTQMVTGEECDDGNADSTDKCTTSCLLPKCGDGFVQNSNSEGCDDGNTIDGDGCPANCQPEVVKLAAGAFHTCAVFQDRRVKCWGGNALGQLGLGDVKNRGNLPNEMGNHLPLVDIDDSVVSLAAGSMHTCALFANGQVKCWGANQFGQLGIGSTDARGDGPNEMGLALPPVELGEKAIAISAGNVHSCALLASGSVKCWGYGYFGQLGQESRSNFGMLANDNLANLPAINLGTGKTAIGISAGQYHTCALLDDGSVKCWGNNEFGQLGLGDILDRGDEPGEMGDSLNAIDLGMNAKNIESGAGHVCAILENNDVKCWGANYFGQLGLGDTENRGDDAGEMNSLSFIDFGTVQATIAFSLGSTHTCMQLVDNSLRCFGRGNYGQLGQGNVDWIGDVPGELAALLPVDPGSNIMAMGFTTGIDHTCAIVEKGQVKCWGRNDQGQLGLGDVKARGDELNEMGDFLPVVPLW